MDGGFLMVGFSESNDFDIQDARGSYDVWVVKVDASGTMQWEQSLGGSGIDIAQDVIMTAEGDFIIVAQSFSKDIQVTSNNGQSDVWLIKIDPNGNLIWERDPLGGTGFENVSNVSLTKDGGLVRGNSKSADGDLSSNFGENDIWLGRQTVSVRSHFSRTLAG